jgi:hypothetical protein
MKMTKRQRPEQAEAIAELRELLKPGDTVHTTLRHVSRSGMSRRLDVVIVRAGDVQTITGQVTAALGYRVPSGAGLRVDGCGMDTGFAVVYGLSRALWPSGVGCIGERCRSNDHCNGDRSRVVHTGNGADSRIVEAARKDPGAQLGDHWHANGGYALHHRWL